MGAILFLIDSLRIFLTDLCIKLPTFWRILEEKDDEIGKLRNCLLEISSEVSKMHGSLTNLETTSSASKEDSGNGGLDPVETRAVISKLQHVHTSIQQYKR